LKREAERFGFHDARTVSPQSAKQYQLARMTLVRDAYAGRLAVRFYRVEPDVSAFMLLTRDEGIAYTMFSGNACTISESE
jgi:hypothetical protein